MIVGPLAARKMSKKDSGDYILAGRSVPTWIVTGGVIATMINSATLLGFGGTGYSFGVSGYFASMGFNVVIVWMGIWLIPRLYRANLTTVPELFSRLFGWKHKVVAIILVACRDLGVTAGTAIGMAVVFRSVFGISLDLALVITLVVTLVFTVVGGMWAVMITDTFQAIFILVGTTIMIPLAIAYIGGWDVVVNMIPKTHVNILNAGGSQSFAWLISGALTCVAYQTLIQRGLAAESEQVAKKSFVYAGTITLGWYIIPFLVGAFALLIFPGITPQDAFLRMTSLFGTFGSLIFAVIIVASCISTLSSTVLTSASNISHDIYKQWINPNASEKSILLVSRVSTVGIAILGTLIGRSLPYILELLLTGGRIMAASLAPVMLAIVFWKAARKAYYSTMAAMVFGSIATVWAIVAGNQVGSAGEGDVIFVWALDPIFIGLPITLVILIFGTLLENKWLTKKSRQFEPHETDQLPDTGFVQL